MEYLIESQNDDEWRAVFFSFCSRAQSAQSCVDWRRQCWFFISCSGILITAFDNRLIEISWSYFLFNLIINVSLLCRPSTQNRESGCGCKKCPPWGRKKAQIHLKTSCWFSAGGRLNVCSIALNFAFPSLLGREPNSCKLPNRLVLKMNFSSRIKNTSELLVSDGKRVRVALFVLDSPHETDGKSAGVESRWVCCETWKVSCVLIEINRIVASELLSMELHWASGWSFRRDNNEKLDIQLENSNRQILIELWVMELG